MVVKGSLGRKAAYVGLCIAFLLILGWFAIGETPAAPRLSNLVKPYDPLP
ncbi:MAG: hypothetical protein AAGC69_13245 [Paracraurococcus sp.]